MPCNTYRISTALRLKHKDFDSILKKLDNLKRHTERTNPIDHTEKLVKVQGWAKHMEEIYSNLVHLRNGIENIASSWDVAILVTKVEEIVNVDQRRRKIREVRSSTLKLR